MNRKTWRFPAVVLAATLSLTGCDNRRDAAPVADPVEVRESDELDTTVELGDPARERLDVNIDLDADDPATSERAELRQQRRENLRNAIDNIDVNVGEQGVDVNVE